MKRIPIFPTFLVVAAASVMVWLGFWQLGRADEKAEMISRYSTAVDLPPVSSGDLLDADQYLFRRTTIECDEPKGWRAIAGRNDRDQTGYVHQFECRKGRMMPGLDDFFYRPALIVAVGWSTSPRQPEFSGGEVEGIITQAGNDLKITSSTPLAGLQPLAKPDPNDLPNNHLAYAGQWFFFALTALAVYGFALRSRWRKAG